jgi:hypothetical protein
MSCRIVRHRLARQSGVRISKMLLTNPHKVIRSRKMDARNIDKVQFRAPCRALRQDGITGFYAGLPASFPTLACLLVVCHVRIGVATVTATFFWKRQQMPR